MTRDARSPDTAIRLGKIGVSPGPHRPEFPTEPIKPDHASTPLLSDEVRPSPTVETAEPAETASGKVRRLSFSTQDSPPALPDVQDTPAVRAASSIRPKPGPPPCGRTEQPAAVPRTATLREAGSSCRCRPNRATKRRARITDSFRASAPDNDAREPSPSPLSSHAKPGLQRNNKSRSLSLRLSVRNGSKISRSYCAFAMLNSIDIGSKFGIDTSAPSSSWTEICITVSVNFRLEVSSS